MELINRGKLLKHLSNWWLSETPSGNGEILFINGVPQKTPTMKVIEECIKAVEDQPTAYDIDKIVEQMEKASHWTEPTYDEDGYSYDDEIEVIDLSDAIEIVKGGAE